MPSDSQPMNFENGRWICTPESPMPKGADGLWEHTDTVDDGECSEGCCDYRKCVNCGKRFRVEVAQWGDEIMMSEEERYIRDRWEWVVAFEPIPDDPYGIVRLADKTALHEYTFEKDDLSAAWSAAKAFTVERERQIAEVEEEIAWLKEELVWEPDILPFRAIATRILAREQAHLNQLKKGMRPVKAVEGVA